MRTDDSGAHRGTMMDVALSVGSIVQRAGSLFGDAPIMVRTPTGIHRTDYRAFATLVGSLANALIDLGVRPGQRVASFAWNTLEHLALYFAVPSIGAVLHTVNIRLSPDDVRYVLNDADDSVLFYDGTLADALPEFTGTAVRTLIEMGSEAVPAYPAALRFSDLFGDHNRAFDFVEVPEQSAAILCHTSGTTGRPKGVEYTHRSICIHALAANQPDALGICERDVVLPIVPMFHANAWNLPFITAMAGAGLVLPGAAPTPASIAGLIAECGVTVSAAVPTVWQGLLEVADEDQLKSVRELMGGGSAVPEAMIRTFDERFGIPLVQGWGMTETSPLAAISRQRDPHSTATEATYSQQARQGRPIAFVQTRIDDAAGGELQLAGPTVTGAYLNDVSSDSFTPDGWLRTGDVVEVDDQGYLTLIDRTKDLIKSGGEWISSVELENAALFHQQIVEAAVVARPDDKWGERPCMFAVLTAGSTLKAVDLQDFLSQRFPRWWIPDSVYLVESLPKTSVCKIDKKVLRNRAGESMRRDEPSSHIDTSTP